ncbi:hypothetical protein EB001_18350 [bacterium]|nr:hypothetical protein [bacterium]
MATVLTTQTLVDTNRHSVIKVVGTGGNDANVRLVVAANLAYAINATGAISNLNPKRLNRIAIKRVWGHGQMGVANNVTLKWSGNSNTSIVTFGHGFFDYSFDSGSTPGTIEIPDQANCTGDIIFTSTAGATDSWTLFIDLKKDGRDYDQGQTRDPIAFNYGTGHNGA